MYLEVDEGSYGGRPGRDGLDSVDCLIANTRNNPIEELEWRFPMRTERYELRDEPSAAGRNRGGIGMVRLNRFLVDTIVTCEGERHDTDPPWGIFGGHEGLNASLVKNRGRDDEERWPSKVTAYRLKAGDTLEITVPTRAATATRWSVTPSSSSRTSSTASRRSSSPSATTRVVIDPETMTVDAEATRRVRTERAESALTSRTPLGSHLGAPSRGTEHPD